MNKAPVHVLAVPCTEEEFRRFEDLIFAANDARHDVRLGARADLAAFVNEHGRAKCDLMMVALANHHDKPAES
ncbi:hypothetical protein [Rhodopseudomonas pseudopalustris]|uniref:Uncharacterized protein n=1 Tax=Rhodopseudomonas pseudopalustris TaxID=1513892 RepID=A0A1H8WHP8_9BRAD|nr:hypothetical protein [Rhodopseudomonas pseudopalustris]SEP27162.1 hypothetical protein SAMN05444123_112103 [Rhodopseudomonas pseudopalustris]